MKTKLLFIVFAGVAMFFGALYSWWLVGAIHCLAGVLTFRLNGGPGAFRHWNLGKTGTFVGLMIGGLLSLGILAAED